jgi:hypothetical protein
MSKQCQSGRNVNGTTASICIRQQHNMLNTGLLGATRLERCAGTWGSTAAAASHRNLVLTSQLKVDSLMVHIHVQDTVVMRKGKESKTNRPIKENSVAICL